MTIERLQQVVRVLEGLPSSVGFSLDRWTCGTTACAIGWAARDPWFTRRGLKMEEEWEGDSGDGSPYFREEYDWNAIVAFFGLTRGEAEYLFYSDAYKRGSKYYVMRRISRFNTRLVRRLSNERGAS